MNDSDERDHAEEAANARLMREPDESEQPMPTPNDGPSIQSLVRADLEARERLGRARYGTSLQAHNGRDALRDAYEEALDLSCYLRQALEERGAEAHAGHR